MEMDLSQGCRSPELVEMLVSSAFWIFPIGALVLRRHFVNATGSLLVAKIVMNTLAWLSVPGAFFSALMIVAGLIESVQAIWSLTPELW